MRVLEKIDVFLSDIDNEIPQKGRRKKIRLYAEGVKAKLKQAQYSLIKLGELSGSTAQSVTTTASYLPDISEQVGFYCDSFWAFLYSSLDVLAHVINETLKLQMKEKDVSIKKVNFQINKTHKTAKLAGPMNTLIKSNAFKNLDAYRNCSIHRRQICIFETNVTMTQTPGYETTSTGPLNYVVRTICDNPESLTPQNRQQKMIPKYLDDTNNKIAKQIETILKSLIPIK